MPVSFCLEGLIKVSQSKAGLFRWECIGGQGCLEIGLGKKTKPLVQLTLGWLLFFGVLVGRARGINGKPHSFGVASNLENGEVTHLWFAPKNES